VSRVDEQSKQEAEKKIVSLEQQVNELRSQLKSEKKTNGIHQAKLKELNSDLNTQKVC